MWTNSQPTPRERCPLPRLPVARWPAPVPIPAELLDVDVQQLAGPALLVAIGRLRWPEPGEPAESDPREDPRHRRERHPQRHRDLLSREAQPPEAGDRLQPLLRRAVRLALGGRRAIGQARLPLGAIAPNPLATGALAHSGGFGRLRERLPLLDDAPAHHQPAPRTEPGVSVELHPVSSLGLVASTPPSLEGGPDEQRSQEQELQLGLILLRERRHVPRPRTTGAAAPSRGRSAAAGTHDAGPPGAPAVRRRGHGAASRLGSCPARVASSQ
jgi:hypothetical protein